MSLDLAASASAAALRSFLACLIMYAMDSQAAARTNRRVSIVYQGNSSSSSSWGTGSTTRSNSMTWPGVMVTFRSRGWYPALVTLRE